VKNKLIIYTDAGYQIKAKKMFGPIFAAYVKKDEAGIEYFQHVFNEEPLSSCHAEYYGLLFALQNLAEYRYGRVTILSDNQTMVRQMQGRYGVHKKELGRLKRLCDTIWLLAVIKGNIINIRHTPRKYNLADKFVQELKKQHLGSKK